VPLPDEEIIYGVARDVSERKAMEDELERLSRHDSLTGLLNRRSFDEALREVAGVLSANLRQTDTVGRDAGGVAGRLGGDEFAIVLPEADATAAESAAGRLVAALRDSPLQIEGHEVQLRISVGIALFDADGCPPAEDLIAAADRAMYTAKAAGGDGAVLAPVPRPSPARESV